MEYVVSIENSKYMRWQAALLHQSMKMLGLGDQLVVGVAGEGGFPYGRVFNHQNVGRECNYMPLNKPFAVAEALRNKILKPPFMVLDPDMFLVWPFEEMSNSVTAQRVDHMKYDYLMANGYDLKALGQSKETWQAAGCVYQFKDAGPELFDEMCDIIHFLLNAQFASLGMAWQREMIAFAKVVSGLQCQLVDHWEMPLFPGAVKKLANVVHYYNGFPPYFEKKRQDEARPVRFGIEGPLEEILAMPEYNTPFYLPAVGQRVWFPQVTKMKEIARRMSWNEL